MDNIKRPERRRGPDTMVKAISIFSGLTWLLILILFIIISYAQPKTPTLFDRKAGIVGSQTWDQAMLGYAAIALTITAVICFAGLAINASRHRRRTDFYNRSLVIFGVGSIIGIISYFIFV